MDLTRLEHTVLHSIVSLYETKPGVVQIEPIAEHSGIEAKDVGRAIELLGNHQPKLFDVSGRNLAGDPDGVVRVTNYARQLARA
ncbi:hypothetical protein [Streptosporangium sandarakinum]|uniref:hypothetical protein n=1 Tax=Streptosporangium sandarakinum TaxID=1260955 RepID=UPI0036951A1B